MRKAVGLGLSAVAIFATGLTMPAASAAVASTAAVNAPAPGPDADTTVTFAVTSGAITMTAPDAADLGPGAPGTDIVHEIGTVLVTDDRAALSAHWNATASATDFKTAGGTTPETIPATDVDYAPGTITTTGGITATPHDITLDHEATLVVAGTAGVGNNTASWNPTLTVHVPIQAVTGTYTGTLTQSVS
jgi:hypothetical protein